MTAMQKHLEIHLPLKNQENFWAKPWYIALRTQCLPNLFN